MTRIANDPGIQRRHYVRKATAGNYWFDFMASKVGDFRARFGDDFCLVVNGSDSLDDVYILPYTIAKTVFTPDAVDGRGRWVGTIRGSTMTLAPSGNFLNVAAYHNAFELLNSSAPPSRIVAPMPVVSVTPGSASDEQIGASALVVTAIPPSLPDEQPPVQFVLEAHLRDFLAANLERIESGLRLYSGANHDGIEYPVENGRIDLLAVDRAGKFVVIELKLSQGRNRTLGQLLYYMSWVDQNLGNAPCRGVIIANDISDDLRIAISRVPGVSLARYRMSFSVDHLEGPA